MNMKVLFCATVLGHIKSFHQPYLRLFKDMGFEVHVAAKKNVECIDSMDLFYNIPFSRSPFKLNNIRAYVKLKKIIKENKYEVIHFHTPVAGVLGRMAARKERAKGTKILYTAHGFHFYQGASLKNWLLYYPVEKWLAKYTDCLITINNEDYKKVKSTFKAGRIVKVNGVGIDINKFKPQTQKAKFALREKYGYNDHDFIMIYVAELSKRKNQKQIIEALNLLKDRLANTRLLLVGDGPLVQSYKKMVVKLGLENNVLFLGYRNDIPNLMVLSDVAISSSRQEGLPVNVMEAMATGLPLIVANSRGNRDLVRDGENGYVVELDKAEFLADAIERLYSSKNQRQTFGKRNLELIERYSLPRVLKEMEAVYQKYLS